MNLSRARVVLRERGLLDVLDLALRFLVEHGGVYARTCCIVIPPFFAASVLVARAGGWFAAWAFAVFAAALAGAPFTVLASRLVFEDDVRASRAVGDAVRAAPRLIALRLFTFVGGALGLAVLTFPGVWLLAVTLFVTEVATLEKATVRVAIARSTRIVRCESGEAVMALLLLTLLHVIAVIAADSGGRTVFTALLESRAPATMWNDGWSALSLLGFWLFVPYVATARFLVYLDVRTRSEGWDIQTRFVALATRAVPDARSAA
jgi:hypothetical protein